MANKEELLEVLKGVIDPEIGINIVDLGLVYEVESNEDTKRNYNDINYTGLSNAHQYFNLG